ncbi:metal binding domain of Ada-domain-containing protein [Tricharina praecox]|uniref:metal binding domain of Ada-domain-containing protein n=1 Tax=Tricharina praecox TaxID=43433 RepID=UPI00221E9A46|nr:metal binding domain of Ada-domain-containing protein [Tricharina praecox]KAI5855804.1 metal binding domain of Ada-domain-containing protein [Tricharina praecox]
MPTSSLRWLILQSRDPNYHSAFVYAVKTTKIFCRPTCSARLARRTNVVFYDTPLEAAAAGFKACKRCHPEVEGWHPKGEAMVQRAKTIIEASSEEIPLKTLAAKVGVTEWHFSRRFKKEVGITPRAYYGVVCEHRRRKSIPTTAQIDDDHGTEENTEEKVEAVGTAEELCEEFTRDEFREFTMDEFVDWDGGGGPCAPCPIYATEICAEVSF